MDLWKIEKIEKSIIDPWSAWWCGTWSPHSSKAPGSNLTAS